MSSQAILVPRNWQFHVFIVFKMRTTSNSTNLSVVPNFNIIIEMNGFHIPNFNYKLIPLPRYWNFHVFIVFKRLLHQIPLILTIDSHFNTTIEISIISYHYMLTFNLLLWFVVKILAILCFPYLQNDDVIKFDQFCMLIQISIQESKSASYITSSYLT